jgi:hypothetical protein
MEITIRPKGLRWTGYALVAGGLGLVMAGVRAWWVIAVIALGGGLTWGARMLEVIGRRRAGSREGE